MKKNNTLCLLVSLFSLAAGAQKTDTVVIQPKDIHTNVLIPGMHRWLVYFKMGKDSSRSRFFIWSRRIDRISYRGKDAISVTQEWENNDTIMHTVYTVCDSKDFAPLYQKAWTKQSGSSEFDFLDKTMKLNGRTITAADTARAVTISYKAFQSALQQYVLDWHLDLEVFPLLPFRNHTTYAINYYDPGFGAPKRVYYTVTGSAVIKGYDGQDIDCWLLEHTDQGRMSNKEVFYISKKTREVLKLEQEFAGRYRYKIKMAFSN